MKKISLGDYLLCYLAKGLSFFFRIMPVSLALFIARRLGELSMFFNLKRKRIAYANLKAAFGNKYSPKELRAILRKVYQNIGQGVMDVLLLPKMDEKYIRHYIKFESFQLARPFVNFFDDAFNTFFIQSTFKDGFDFKHEALDIPGFPG